MLCLCDAKNPCKGKPCVKGNFADNVYFLNEVQISQFIEIKGGL